MAIKKINEMNKNRQATTKEFDEERAVTDCCQGQLQTRNLPMVKITTPGRQAEQLLRDGPRVPSIYSMQLTP
jgi:hypothetical protein